MRRLKRTLALAAAVASGAVLLSLPGQNRNKAGETATPQPSTNAPAVRHFPPEIYHGSAQNWAAVEDNRGVIYFANSSGVLEFDGVRWRLIELPNHGGAYALGKAGDGRILVGGEGEAGWLAPDADGTMQYVSKTSELPAQFHAERDRLVHIFESPIGQVYLSDHFLFIKKSGVEVTTLRSADHFMQAVWFNGAVYVIDSGRGLLRLNGGSLEAVAGGARLRGLAMVVTSAGLVVPSYDEGLIRYAPSNSNPWQSISIPGWTPEDSADVTSGEALSSNLTAFGTGKNGVALIDFAQGTLQRIDSAHGLKEQHIDSMEYDGNGGLWLAQENGISLVGVNLAREESALPFQALVRGVVSTRDEHRIFGGAFVSSAGAVQQLVQGEKQKEEFPYSTNAFRFEYSANGLSASGEMQFQTYLQGVDADWSPWASRSEREFTNIPAGHWLFRVRARRASGEVSSEARYEFTIRPLWYTTWWFTILEVVVVMSLILLPGHMPHPTVQGVLTTFGVTVVFVYVGNWVSDLVSHYVSSDISIVSVLISALLAVGLAPAQNMFQAIVEKRNRKRLELRERKRRRNLGLPEAESEQSPEEKH